MGASRLGGACTNPRLWYGPRLVRRGTTKPAALLAAVCAGAVGAALLPGSSGADSTNGQPARAVTLTAREAVLAKRSSSAVLTLYALRTRLGAARSELARVSAERDAVAAERVATRRHLKLAEQALAGSQRRLGDLVRAVYENGQADPLAVLLGAESLDAALTGLDAIESAVGQSRHIVAQVRTASTRLKVTTSRLTAREAELRRLAGSAASSAASLESAAAERSAYVERLQHERRITARQLATLEVTVREAEAKARILTPEAPAPAPVADAAAAITPRAPETTPAAGGSRTLVVEATGYSLPGRTATGLPVGWGVIAVDPAVIPLGSRLTVPGYGEAVAADTGSAVQGAIIDLWFPTTAQALQWGRRTVTVTIH